MDTTRTRNVPQPPNKKTGRPSVRACAITLVLTLGLLVAAFFAPHILANHYRKQLESVSDQRAQTLVDKVARLGKAGIPVLAEALGSPQEQVAAAASRSLWSEMERWESLSISESSPRLQLLAQALADQVESYGPTSRTEAAALVRAILGRHLDREVVDQGQVALYCEKVLYATTFQRRLSANTDLLGSAEHTSVGGETLRRATSSPDFSGGFPEPRIRPNETHTSPLANPAQPEAQPETPPTSTLEPALAPQSLLEQPRRILQPEFAQPFPRFAGRSPVEREEVSKDDGWQPMPDSWESGHVRPPELFPSDSLPSQDMTSLSTVDLMRRLQSLDLWTLAQAEGELTLRGFTSVHFDLARRLFDPDARVRQQLVQFLPTVPSVDAVPWLMELSRDADPQVRLAAISLMSTSGQPTLLSQLRQLSESDPDLTVRRRAGEILR